MIERQGKFLPREDTDAAHLLQEQLKKDGVHIHLNSSLVSFELISHKDGEFPQISVKILENGNIDNLVVESVLIATGRRPNVHGMALDIAGVEFNET